MIGLTDGDDAAVFRLRPDLAVITTVDFFTPVVDDPRAFGAIAAANALSDVYAMGGRPLTALGLLCADPDALPPGTIEEILAGGMEKLGEAGTLLVGGHSVRDPELKYGFAVTGTVHPKDLIPARGARAGDLLVLTKPLGTGLLSTALKRRALDPADEAALAESMARLNAAAGSALKPAGAHAATDITGFGLAGHGVNLSGGLEPATPRRAVTLRIESAALPLLPGARRAAESEMFAGGLTANRAYFGGAVSFAPAVPEWLRAVVFDPQTSGGILAALPERGLPLMRRRLAAADQEMWVVGRVEKRGPHAIVVE